MKFSSISLIAAAIAGSAIAAPGPLCARALEQVNSLGRDLDVYPREWVAVQKHDVDGEHIDLFTRAALKHQVEHHRVVGHLQDAIVAHHKAANWAHAAYQMYLAQGLIPQSDSWYDSYIRHLQTAQSLGPMHTNHLNAANSPQTTNLHASVNQHWEFAKQKKEEAAETIQKVWNEAHNAGMNV